ncbi:MAG: branched-chain amino acid ABC transporter permease [Thermoanaerobaculia bacterium]
MKRLLVSAALVAALFLANGLLSGSLISGVSISPYTLRILCLAGINVILAVSLNLPNGFAGQFSLGHAGFMAIGAYASAFTTVTCGERIQAAVSFLPAVGRDSVLLLVSLAVGALLAAVAGFFVGVPSLRLRGDYLAIVTLGFGEMIRVIILNIDAVGGARGYSGIPKIANFFWIWLFAAVSVAVVHRIVRSSFGRTLIAIREDEIAAEAMGVDTTRSKVTSFVVSAALTGIAGGLFGHYDMYINTNSFSFLKSFDMIIMIVIGGLGSITGSVLGAFVFIFLSEALRGLGAYRVVLFALLLIVIMRVRPQGILGHRELPELLRWRKSS